jgi:hypothetical protein
MSWPACHSNSKYIPTVPCGIAPVSMVHLAVDKVP